MTTALQMQDEATSGAAVGALLDRRVRPLRAAYADPPYLGLAHKFYGHLHPEASEYDKPEGWGADDRGKLVHTCGDTGLSDSRVLAVLAARLGRRDAD